MKKLSGKRVAILAADGFESSELFEPKAALEENGAEVDIISLGAVNIRGWEDGNWTEQLTVDRIIDDAKQSDYHALMIPGGVINPDLLRRNKKAVAFTRDFFQNYKPVAAICHGPQMLIEADVVDGRKVTSFPSIKTDLKNAGAEWVDEKVVVDEGLVTSRSPEDMKAFCDKMIEEIAEGKHEAQTI